MKLSLEEVCQVSMSGLVRPSPDSPISSSCCASEQYAESPQIVAMNSNSDKLCHDSTSVQPEAFPGSLSSSSRCSSEQCAGTPGLLPSDDEKDGADSGMWNAMQLKAAMKLNLEQVCQDSMSGRMTMSPDSPMSSSRFSSVQYIETP